MKEHLELYEIFKGKERDEIEPTISQMLLGLDLAD
jgi:hypothetical protein